MDEARARRLLAEARARIQRQLAELEGDHVGDELADYDQHLADVGTEVFEEADGTAGVGAGLVRAGLLPVELLHDDQRHDDIVFLESEEGVRVGEQHAGIQDEGALVEAPVLHSAHRLASRTEKCKDPHDAPGAPWCRVLQGGLRRHGSRDTTPARGGLASSLTGSHRYLQQGPPVPSAGRLLDSTARELAEGLRSPSELEASIGMAAVNALLDVDENACEVVNAVNVILEHGTGRRVAVVGHFPFVDRIRSRAETCWVLEREPGPGDEAAERADEILPAADVVAMSGTTLVNRSFDRLIELCRDDAYVLLLGASAPLTPLLFEYGVDAVAGTRLSDIEAAVRAVTQGATFRQIPERRLLTMKRTKRDV